MKERHSYNNVEPLDWQEYKLWHDRIDRALECFDASAAPTEIVPLCQHIVIGLKDIFRSDEACIYLMSAEGDRLVEYARIDRQKEADDDEFRYLPISAGRAKQLVEERFPIVTDFVNPNDVDLMPRNLKELDYNSSLSVPIVSKGETLGFYTLMQYQDRDWKDGFEDYSWPLLVGKIVGSFVHYALNSQKIAELASIQERARLGKEIHDNLSQLIGLMVFGAEMASMAYEDGNTEALVVGLERQGKIAQEAYRVLRSEILHLCESEENGKDLIVQIDGYLKRCQSLWGIDTSLSVGRFESKSDVSTLTSLNLIRILHEAVSNALRHASAKTITVDLREVSDNLVMTIDDDGSGFDSSAVPDRCMGIKIMEERAKLLGGEMRIASTIGSGTSVCVRVPFLV